RLWRRRSLHHRHFRRRRAGRDDRRAADRDRARTDGRAAAAALSRKAAARRGGSLPPVTIRIAMWSGPRNLSTAMMRSFGSRRDTVVSDEPFYGAFLKTTGLDHPMRDETIAAVDCDWSSVMASLRGSPAEDRPI